MLSRSLAATSNHIVGLPIGVPLCRRLSALLAALWLPVLVGPGISPTGGRFETVEVVAPAVAVFLGRFGGRETAVDQPQMGAVAVGGKQRFDRAGAGFGDAVLTLPAPGEDDSVRRVRGPLSPRAPPPRL